MKRSEMVTIIASELINDQNFMPIYRANMMAERLLARIESEKMLPPFSTKMYKTGLGGYEGYEWEQE